MSLIERDIFSTPEVLRLTLRRIAERGATLDALLRGPVAMLGCGSSYCIAQAMAALYEDARGEPAQAFLASEYRPRRGWSHLAISRTGKTSELFEAMRRVRAAGLPVALLGGEPDAPAIELADALLALEFAPEQAIIQTRFISAATLALRLLIGAPDDAPALELLPAAVEQALDTFDIRPMLAHDHVVFLGRGWRHGLAVAAALNQQETTLQAAEGHQTLDYRHGPIASAGAGTLVWCFDAPDDPLSGAVLDDVRRTGATVYCSGDDPQVDLARAQLLAVRRAVARGVDPEAPRHLTRAIVLPAP